MKIAVVKSEDQLQQASRPDGKCRQLCCSELDCCPMFAIIAEAITPMQFTADVRTDDHSRQTNEAAMSATAGC